MKGWVEIPPQMTLKKGKEPSRLVPLSLMGDGCEGRRSRSDFPLEFVIIRGEKNWKQWHLKK